jgi:membrane protein required for colicin V production
MIDFVLGVGLAALLIRGWLRGLVREAIGLGVIVAGTFMAFRLAGPMGAVVSAMTGAGEDAARIAGGIIVFLLFSVGGAVVSWLMHKGVRALPGLTTVNRLGGAAFSGLAAVLAATVVVSVLTLLPLPSGPANALQGSTLIGSMTDADSWPQKLVGLISFDRVMAEALELQSVAGDHRVVAPARGRIDIEPVPEDDLVIRAKAATRLAQMINRSRVDLEVDPMARSDVLDEVALRHALALYEVGRVSHNSGQGRIGARLADADVPVVVSGEAVALAPTPRSAYEIILDDPNGHADIANSAFRRLGTAAVRGPLGLLVVVVFAG